MVMVTSRDLLEAQAYERRRIQAAFLADARLIESSPWRPVVFGGLVAGVLLAGAAAIPLFG